MSKIQDVDQLQLDAYRRMTAEERLRIGLGLYEASLAIARERIRNRFPEADDAEVEEKFHARIRAGYEIEGDTAGTQHYTEGWLNRFFWGVMV